MNAQPPTGRSAGCPSPESMRAFHSGRLPPPEMEALADHLGVCTACAAAFEAMADDPVVSKLRQYLPQPTPALDPECERLAAAARLIPLEPTGAETSLRDTPSYEPRTLAAPPPRRFADYDLLQQLGAGGMGVVWKARHLRLNRLVALKMVRFASAADGPERQRFRREGEAVARVKHPNIVEIYDADEVDGQPYIAMELLEGGTLARRVRDRPLTPREAAGLVRTLALAVQAAHDRGVVHRDLKPTNVLFAADDTPKVADFGLAKLLDAETGQTRTGDVLGTPAYMAPEQARGDAGRIGPRTDVYGLGAMLYELLHGKPPFRGADRKAVLKQVLHGRPESAKGKQQGPRQGLATICREVPGEGAARPLPVGGGAGGGPGPLVGRPGAGGETAGAAGADQPVRAAPQVPVRVAGGVRPGGDGGADRVVVAAPGRRRRGPGDRTAVGTGRSGGADRQRPHQRAGLVARGDGDRRDGSFRQEGPCRRGRSRLPFAELQSRLAGTGARPADGSLRHPGRGPP